MVDEISEFRIMEILNNIKIVYHIGLWYNHIGVKLIMDRQQLFLVIILKGEGIELWKIQSTH